MKLTTTLIVALSVAGFASAQTSSSGTPGTSTAANPNVRHVIGLDTIDRNATGKLTVQDSTLEFNTGKADTKVAVSAIDDIFIGTETTQSGGKAGTAVKTAAIAAPYGGGKALTIMMRTKVDILTVSYHDPDGAHARCNLCASNRPSRTDADATDAGGCARQPLRRKDQRREQTMKSPRDFRPRCLVIDARDSLDRPGSNCPKAEAFCLSHSNRNGRCRRHSDSRGVPFRRL